MLLLHFTMLWSIETDAEEGGETSTNFGLITNFFPIFNISFDNVAEKNNVCLILGIFLILTLYQG